MRRDIIGNEPSLDPADWGALRAVFQTAMEDGISHLEAALTTPVWTAPPQASIAALTEPLPQEGMALDEVYATFKSHILPYGTGNVHPAFFGWVHGGGNVQGALGEMLAAFMNCNLGGRNHIANQVERQVIDWCKEMVGFPVSASGILTSGTSLGTVIAMAVARNVMAQGDVARDGVAAAGLGLVGYASTEAHSCFAKAFDILGLGRANVRMVPVNGAREIDCDALDAMIAEDRAKGLRPFCAVATAGTVNTGAIDDIARVGDICAKHKLWFHVDAAFGVGALLTQDHRHRVDAMSGADSTAFDFHKWFQVPYDAGIVLIRDAKAHHDAFAARKEYLAPAERGLAGGEPWFCDYGPELSRTFRALKVWFTFKSHGIAGLSAIIEKNCRQAHALAELVEANAPHLEMLAPVSLNVVCFRYVPEVGDAGFIDWINKEIVADLQELGISAPSTTTLSGRTAIRVCLVNHRTRTQDLEQLVAATLELGKVREAASAA